MWYNRIFLNKYLITTIFIGYNTIFAIINLNIFKKRIYYG